jgi:hypothetical protein
MFDFARIPLPFDGPAGQGLLTRLPQALRGMCVSRISRTMRGLVSARVELPQTLISALWDALIRDSAFISRREIVEVLGYTALLENKAAVPDEARVMLLQAAARCAPRLDRKSAESAMQWLGILGWEAAEVLRSRRAA